MSDQRSLVRMDATEVLEFLRACHTMYLSTLNRDGTIHSIAMWYGFLGDQVAFSTRVKSQKAQNLMRNPTLTCLFENGSHAYQELKGVQIVGKARVLEDREERFEAFRTAYERNVGSYDETKRDAVERASTGLLIVAVEPIRFASWDHSKLQASGPARLSADA